MITTRLESVLLARAEQMRTELVEWAKKEQVLGPGQKLLVSIGVCEDEPNVDFQVKNVTYARDLTVEDWKSVMAMPLYTGVGSHKKEMHRIFRRLQKSPESNVALSFNQAVQYNGIFRRHWLAYKFVRVVEAESPGRGCAYYRLFGKS